MSIAGFDPSGGAGLLADSKTFEQHKVYGLCVNTANTLQTEHTFYSIQWISLEEVLRSIKIILKEYPVQFIKTGIMPSVDFLEQVVLFIKRNHPEIKIIIDPILKTSTGYGLQESVNLENWIRILKNTYLLTPNADEILCLTGYDDAEKAAAYLSRYCAVLLKGGHHKKEPGVDFLYEQEHVIRIEGELKNKMEKHGSGCVLSAAIAANLASGLDLKQSCIAAKKYVEHFLFSNESLLGYHHV